MDAGQDTIVVARVLSQWKLAGRVFLLLWFSEPAADTAARALLSYLVRSVCAFSELGFAPGVWLLEKDIFG